MSASSRRRVRVRARRLAAAGLGAALLGGLVLVAGAPAQVPSVSVDAACYAAGQPITVSGSGFVANARLSIRAGTSPMSATATADANGVLAPTPVRAPAVRTIAPRRVTVSIHDEGDDAEAARLRIGVVREAYASSAPIGGDPSERTTWRFAGFAPGRPIYGHFRLRSKTLRNYRFGTAAGACGTLVVRARRIPIRDAPAGRWQLKLDQRPRYARETPGRLITFRIFRR